VSIYGVRRTRIARRWRGEEAGGGLSACGWGAAGGHGGAAALRREGAAGVDEVWRGSFAGRRDTYRSTRFGRRRPGGGRRREAELGGAARRDAATARVRARARAWGMAQKRGLGAVGGDER
jgi:hypothetical protein